MAESAQKKARGAPAPSPPLPLGHKSASPTLASFLGGIEKATGLRICIYDLEFFLQNPKLQLSHNLQIHDSPFCHHVKSNPACFEKCMATENQRTEMAGAAGGPILHTCHAGVTDLILPILVEGRQVAAVFIGQTFTEGPEKLRRRLHALKRKYGFKIDELKAMAASLPRMERPDLYLQQAVLGGIADYLEQSVELAKLRTEVDLWRHGGGFSAAHASGDVRTLPTPVIERLRTSLRPGHPVAIAKALDLLKSSYWRNPPAREIARQAGMSEFHFSRQFHKTTGTTFRKCMLESRLTAAFYLLKGSRFTVEQAALAVGYDSGPSLQRAFKGFTGLTPHAFLRTYPRADSLEQAGVRGEARPSMSARPEAP